MAERNEWLLNWRYLHFRDNPSLCSGLFDTDEIDAAIRCICTTEW